MKVLVIFLLICITIIGTLIYLRFTGRMYIIWEIQRRYKKSQIRNEILNIKDTNARASGIGKKIGIVEKGKVKERFYQSREVYYGFVQFCESKNLALTADEENLLTIIDETEDLLDPKNALDRQLARAGIEYDAVYQAVNSSGEELLARRLESAQIIEQSTELVNSIARSPHEFDSDIKEIKIEKDKFREALDFGEEQQTALRNSSIGAGASVAAGAAVASVAPAAAMWVATTFGTASTGTAIAALNGAAATNAALAWLGGGALTAGGGGMAAGQALLALAGPVGWGAAGGSLLLSVLLFWRKKMKLQEDKKDEISRIKNCTMALKELKADIDNLALKTCELNASLGEQLTTCSNLRDGDYSQFSDDEKDRLGSIVNNTKSLSVMLSKVLTAEESNDNSKGKRKARKK